MGTSGKKVYETIVGKLHEVEGQVKDANQLVYDYEGKISALTLERDECYASLAVTYLPELEAESIKRTLSEVQETVREVFKEKQKRRKDLDGILVESNEGIKKLHTDLDSATENLNKKAAERENLTKIIASNLKKNLDYVALDNQAKEADLKLAQNKKSAEEVRKQSAEKLPAYENSKLFMYLKDRGFGTEEYSTGNVIRMLDSWVAKIIDYKNARNCYDFLVSMPELVKAEVDKRKSELDSVVIKLKDYENKESEKEGLPKIIEEASFIAKKRDDLIKKIDEENKVHDRYATERADIDSKKDPYHIEAIQKLKDYLKGEDISALKKIAKESDGDRDDKVVYRIEGIDSTIRDLKDKTKEAKSNRDSYQDKLTGLRDVEKNFTSSDYESHRSYFSDDFDMNTLLVGYLLGKSNTDQLNNSIKESQNFKPRESESYSSSGYGSSSSSSSSSYDSGSSSSFDSGSSWSSGSSFDSGGSWSSGSGF